MKSTEKISYSSMTGVIEYLRHVKSDLRRLAAIAESEELSLLTENIINDLCSAVANYTNIECAKILEFINLGNWHEDELVIETGRNGKIYSINRDDDFVYLCHEQYDRLNEMEEYTAYRRKKVDEAVEDI